MPPRDTAMPMVAGILLVIVALEAIFAGALLATAASTIGPFGELPGAEGFQTILLICGAIFIILGIIVILGGIMSILKKMWALALIASVIGIFTIGFYGTGSILSIIALVLIAISKDEFR
jgi:hypothetical protein